MEHEIVWRILEEQADPAEEIAEDHRQAPEFGIVGSCEIVPVLPWKDPGFEWQRGGIGVDRDETVGLDGHPGAEFKLLLDEIAEETPFFASEVLAGGVELSSHDRRDDRRGDELRVGVGHRCAGFRTLVLEDEDVTKARVSQ